MAIRICGSSASMFCTGGDATPYAVTVDGDAATATNPTLSGGKISLFSGLSDTWHEVTIHATNSDLSQSIPTSGDLFEVYGQTPLVTELGVSYLTTSPSFPGVYAGFVGTDAGSHSYTPSDAYIPTSAVWGTGRATGSIHFKAKFSDIWIMTNRDKAYVSLDGGAMTLVTLVSNQANNGYSGIGQLQWKKLTGIAGSLSSFKEVIISAGSATMSDQYCSVQGVLLTGSGAEMQAPSATKRHLFLFGASQVETNYASTAANDGHMVQPSLNVYTCSDGKSGATVAQGVAGFAAAAAKVKHKDICLLSIGSNSAFVTQPEKDAFLADYKLLIGAAITAGFSRVVCRGISNGDASGFYAEKNTYISQAVTDYVAANPSHDVRYASISAWGAYSSPDNLHPDEAGYRTMATYWARDHAALFA